MIFPALEPVLFVQNFYHGISPALRYLPLVPHQLDHPVKLPGNGLDIVQLEFSLFSLLLFLTFIILVANPKNLLYTVANPAPRGILNRKNNNKNKKMAAPPPSSRAGCSEKKNKNKNTQRIYMPRRSTGLGSSRVRTRILRLVG